MSYREDFSGRKSVLRAERLEVAALTMSPLPIDLSVIKSHCSIDGNDFDTLLETYLFAAINWAEGYTCRSIFSRTHTWVLKEFPIWDNQEIRLPRGKTQSVQNIQYVNGGSTTTITGPTSDTPGTSYQEDLTGDNGGVVMPPQGNNWPSIDYDVPAPVKINFTAGWLSSEVPDQVIHSILFAIDDMFEMRGAKDVQNAGSNLNARMALISPYRLHRFYYG